MSVKVVYLSYDRLTAKTERDWYISELLKEGLDVEYWDIASLISSNLLEPNEVERPYKKIFGNFTELNESVDLAASTDACFVMLFAYDARSAEIYRLLSRYSARMVFLYWGFMPSARRRSRLWFSTLRLRPHLFFVNIFRKFQACVYTRLKLIVSYEVIFVAGERQMALQHFARKVIPINLVDYDRAQVAQLQNEFRQKRYAVFLDINLAYQTDLKILGLKSVDPDKYLQSLNSFFGKIEAATDVSVVIAAHPKSKYNNGSFGSRECVYGLTPELVKGAEFVISHHSTSISYAIAFTKPLIFIHTSEMEALYTDLVIPVIQDLAEFLGAPHINIDRPYNISEIDVKTINKARYDEYKYGYLTSRLSEHQTTREIFINEMHRLTTDAKEVV